jgi:hypothetical protein
VKTGQPRVKSNLSQLDFFTRNFQEKFLLVLGNDDTFLFLNNDNELSDFVNLSDIINTNDFNLFVVAKNKLIGSFRSQPDKLIVIYC